MTEEKNQCTKCGKWKLLDDFHKKHNQCKECMKKYHSKYNQSSKAKESRRIYAVNRSARKYGLPATLTPGQWQHALNYFNGCCAVCGRQMNDMFGEFTISADHWIPLIAYENGPGTVATNIIPLCHGKGGCNNSKVHHLPTFWLDRKYGKRKGRQIAAKIQTYFDSL